jgi:hypothetical protein
MPIASDLDPELGQSLGTPKLPFPWLNANSACCRDRKKILDSGISLFPIDADPGLLGLVCIALLSAHTRTRIDV